MRIFFVRHGESEANVGRVFSNRGWKHPLTPAGREQARVLADELSGRDVTAICSSPIRRAVETSQILAARLGVSVTIDRALAEYDVGVYDGRGDAEGWEVHADVQRRWDEGDLDARMPGGESCSDVCARLLPFIELVLDQYGSRDIALVMVGHGGTWCRALPMVLENVTPGFAVSHELGFTAIVEAKLCDGALRCVRWGGAPLE